MKNTSFLKKWLLVLLCAFLFQGIFIFAKNKPPRMARAASASEKTNTALTVGDADLYEQLHLDVLNLPKAAFQQALAGYKNLLAAGKIANDQYLSIVDFSQPSTRKRLYVIDLRSSKIVFNTYVAHGRNSGLVMASQFSNAAESNKSCLGFFVTGDTYNGKHGFSLRLHGQEQGINDNALSRAIVMHSAPYVSEEAIRSQGYAGRSLGCPALPCNLYKPIIETIKNGSCLFLYSPDPAYTQLSSVLTSKA